MSEQSNQTNGNVRDSFPPSVRPVWLGLRLVTQKGIAAS